MTIEKAWSCDPQLWSHSAFIDLGCNALHVVSFQTTCHRNTVVRRSQSTFFWAMNSPVFCIALIVISCYFAVTSAAGPSGKYSIQQQVFSIKYILILSFEGLVVTFFVSLFRYLIGRCLGISFFYQQQFLWLCQAKLTKILAENFIYVTTSALRYYLT